MATVTFILGLCGAGKTWLADRIIADAKFDEGFLCDPAKHAALIRALSSGQNCVVVEIAYCQEAPRQQIAQEVTGAVLNVTVNWLCIENDLVKANKNCRERTNKGDPDGHIEINGRVSRVYTYPEGGVILSMWTREP
jgi:hypothetical protein